MGIPALERCGQLARALESNGSMQASCKTLGLTRWAAYAAAWRQSLNVTRVNIWSCILSSCYREGVQTNH